MSSSDSTVKEPTSDFQEMVTGVAQYVSGAMQNVKDATGGQVQESFTGKEASTSSDAARHVAIPPPAKGVMTWTDTMVTAFEAAGNKVLPQVHAVERRSGVPSEPDGKSRGLLEDLGHKMEQSFEAMTHAGVMHGAHVPASTAGEKWGEAKSDAKEGVSKLSDAAGEAAEAASLKAKQGVGAAQEGLEETKYQVEGGWQEVKDVTGAAKDSVVGGVRDMKDSTVETARDVKNRVADNAQAAKATALDVKNRAADSAQDAKNRVADNAQAAKERAAGTAHDATDRVACGVHDTLPAEGSNTGSDRGESGRAQGGGLYESISNAVHSVTGRFTGSAGGNTDPDPATYDKAAAKTRSAVDTARGKAQEVKDSAKGAFSPETRGKAQEAKDEVKQASSDAVESAKRASQDVKEGTMNVVQGAKESVTDAAQEAKKVVTDTVESVEDYLTADLSPHTYEEAALQSGHIPSNTADVLASSR